MKPINILLILSLLLLGSCVDKDLNNDPTKSANLNPNFQLTGIELRQWGSMDIGSICNRYMSPLTQQMQGNWDATNYGGQYRNDDNQIKSLWNFMYQNQIKNIVDLVSRTDGDAGYANLNAIARIFSRFSPTYTATYPTSLPAPPISAKTTTRNTTSSRISTTTSSTNSTRPSKPSAPTAAVRTAT